MLSPPRLPLSGTTSILFISLETESAEILCQVLKVFCTWVLPECPLRSLRVQELPLTAAVLRNITVVPGRGALFNLKFFICSHHCGPMSKEELNSPPSRVPMLG
jgi:hypothetical protein